MPDVPPGAYAVTVECEASNPPLIAGLAADVAPFAIGPYTPLSFTVVAPTVPVVEALASTTG